MLIRIVQDKVCALAMDRQCFEADNVSTNAVEISFPFSLHADDQRALHHPVPTAFDISIEENIGLCDHGIVDTFVNYASLVMYDDSS